MPLRETGEGKRGECVLVPLAFAGLVSGNSYFVLKTTVLDVVCCEEFYDWLRQKDDCCHYLKNGCYYYYCYFIIIHTIVIILIFITILITMVMIEYQ